MRPQSRYYGRSTGRGIGTTLLIHAERILLEHGDVVVWGGPARLRYHGVLTLKAGEHPVTGSARYNLTFRKAG